MSDTDDSATLELNPKLFTLGRDTLYHRDVISREKARVTRIKEKKMGKI